MANTFKVSTKSSVGVGSGNASTIYTAPSSTTTVVLALLLANKHSSAVSATVILSSDTGSNADVHIIKDISISNQCSLEIMAGQKYVLETTDAIKVYADNANLDVTLSYMEIT